MLGGQSDQPADADPAGQPVHHHDHRGAVRRGLERSRPARPRPARPPRPRSPGRRTADVLAGHVARGRQVGIGRGHLGPVSPSQEPTWISRSRLSVCTVRAGQRGQRRRRLPGPGQVAGARSPPGRSSASTSAAARPAPDPRASSGMSAWPWNRPVGVPLRPPVPPDDQLGGRHRRSSTPSSIRGQSCQSRSSA